LGATWLLLGLLILSMGGTRGEVAGFNVGATWWSYALKQCEAIILYLRLTIWPHPLIVFYGTDVVTNPLAVWWQLLVLVALVSGTFYAVWKNAVLGFCAMWFFAILAPSSSVVPLISQTVSEHRMYLSVAAPLVLFVAALFMFSPRSALAASLGCASAFGIISARRNVDYRSELSIWADTVAKAPHNARARVNLGAALSGQGDAAGARTQYEIAIQQNPSLPEALNNLATLYLDIKEVTKAIQACEAALRIQPKFALAHNNLGTALIQAGRTAEGISHLQTALQLKPEMAEAHCNLSPALLGMGKTDEALTHAETAVRLKPTLALAHFNLATVLLAKSDVSRAASALETAIQLNPGYAEAHSNLGTLYYRAGDAARAVPHYEAAIRAKPDYLDARNNLASALFQTGKAEHAVEQYRAVIRLQPSYAEAHFNLGLVLSRLGRNSEAIAAYAEAHRLRPDDERAKSELARLRAIQPGASAR
jgi:protein O-mannosyl-transferase